MFEARHLVKRFYGVPAVNDVSFAVRAGEVVGYLGPNGSGKSTTAKMLTGLLETSAGAVFWNGDDISRDPVTFRQRLGYVPEEPNLYTFQSAIEYLELVGRLRELPAALLARKINALLELFGLTHAANQDMGAYSKGMKQKVMIIAALLHDPDVLILDEPDSGLDVTATLVLRHLVIALARSGQSRALQLPRPRARRESVRPRDRHSSRPCRGRRFGRVAAAPHEQRVAGGGLLAARAARRSAADRGGHRRRGRGPCVTAC